MTEPDGRRRRPAMSVLMLFLICDRIDHAINPGHALCAGNEKSDAIANYLAAIVCGPETKPASMRIPGILSHLPGTMATRVEERDRFQA
jgi:hypothetical protein